MKKLTLITGLILTTTTHAMPVVINVYPAFLNNISLSGVGLYSVVGLAFCFTVRGIIKLS